MADGDAAELPPDPNAEPVDDAAPADAESAAEAADASLAADAAAPEPAEEELEPSMESMTLKLPGTNTTKRPNPAAEATAARSGWARLGEEVKPPHLRVPQGVSEIIDRLSQPVRSEHFQAEAPPERHGHGPMQPRANVDPSVVRAFIHRLDKTHDSLVRPQELAELALKQKMGVTDDVIQAMFERIIGQRAQGKQGNVGVSAPEIFKEMKVEKRWVKTIDLDVTCEDGKSYHVVTEQETLENWCSSLYSDFVGEFPQLEMPDSWAGPELERFFTLVLTAKSASGRILQSDLKVQTLLKQMGDTVSNVKSRPKLYIAVTVAGQRQAWGWANPPYRNLWLRFFRAAGLKPLHPVEEVSGKIAAKKEMEDVVNPVIPSNTTTLPKKSTTSKEGLMTTREAKPTAFIRGLHDGIPDDGTRPVRGDRISGGSVEEKRTHSETLVNTAVMQGMAAQAAQLDATADDDPLSWVPQLTAPASAGATASTTHMSFDAQRRFKQVTAKMTRDSEQQRAIGAERKEMAKQASLLGAAGASVANIGITFRGPHGHLGFSHHHLANSVEPSRLKYMKCLDHSWDGSHIDHSRAAFQKEDTKLSKMTPEEKSRQFGTYFVKYDNQTSRVNALEGAKAVRDGYKPWKNHEFRSDLPQRHGKYGRRVFDAQVRETAVGSSVSGVDSKPMEEFDRQQELVHEFLDRSLPPGQHKHFETHLPRAQMPSRKEVDMHGVQMTGHSNNI